MSKLALVLSLEVGRDEVVEGLDDRGVDSKLAVILLQLIKVDADESAVVAYEDLEVFATLNVAMAAAAVAEAVATAMTLRAALILFCLLQIDMPSRKTLCKSFICRMSSSSWRIINLSFQSAIIIEIVVDIVFALTRSCNEFFQLRLQILYQFLLLTMHGESDPSCNYNEIIRRYCQCIAVP